MDLTQITLNRINELGIEPAAEYFGVKPATIRNWVNSKKVPASAAQKVMDEGVTTVPEVPQERATLTAITPERIAGIELRLALLESKIAPSTGIAVVPPQAQQQPPAPPNWTAPHNFRK